MISEERYKTLKEEDPEIVVGKDMTIPADSNESRSTFKNVPGMAKFLEKQYAAMCNKEEVALMRYNMGKPSDKQKTIEEWINPSYAYANSSPKGTSQFSAR